MDKENKMTVNKVLRVVFSILLIFAGAVLSLLGLTGPIGKLLSDIGLALIIAGIVAVFEETVLSRLEQGETAHLVADQVYEKLYQSPLQSVGIRLVSPVRKGFAGYYNWAIHNSPQNLFFAGRAVLHRIDFDFRNRGLGGVEEVITRRMSQGAHLRLMFLDPRSDLIPRLAREEGQDPDQLLGDIATSIAIVERLYNKIKDRDFTTGSLYVRVYDEVPYFAYHRVDEEVIVGFYFSSALGYASAAYEVIDQQTKNFFEGHFLSMYDRASKMTLLSVPPQQTKTNLNRRLLNQLKEALSNALGEEQIKQTFGG